MMKPLWTKCFSNNFIIGLVLIAILCQTGSGYIIDPVPELKLVTRDQWGARPPTEPASQLLTLPAELEVECYLRTKQCHTQDECAQLVRGLQNFHMDVQGLTDIAYNFVIGGDGRVYEGRGWDVQGVYANYYGKESIEIAYLGASNSSEQTEDQLNAFRAFLVYATKNKKLDEDHSWIRIEQRDFVYAIPSP